MTLEWAFIAAVLSGILVGLAYPFIWKVFSPMRVSQEAPKDKPQNDIDDIVKGLPFFIDKEYKTVYLAFHQDEKWHPKAYYYTPKNGTTERYDCHEADIKPGEELIRWANPLEQTIHNLCLEHITFNDRENLEQD